MAGHGWRGPDGEGENAASGRESLTLKGHTGEVHGVAFSPDGKWLATASGDRTVKVWDTTSGQETRTLKGHTGNVNGVAFSPDGKRLASASDDKTVKIWGAGQEVGDSQAAATVPQTAIPNQPKATLSSSASPIAAYVIPNRVNGIVTTDPVTFTKVPGNKVSDIQLAGLTKAGDGKAIEGGKYHLFAIQNRGRMKFNWLGIPRANQLSFRVWNGKSYDLTNVRQPATTVTIDADVPLFQKTIYLLVNHTTADVNATIDTDAVIVTPEQ